MLPAAPLQAQSCLNNHSLISQHKVAGSVGPCAAQQQQSLKPRLSLSRRRASGRCIVQSVAVFVSGWALDGAVVHPAVCIRAQSAINPDGSSRKAASLLLFLIFVLFLCAVKVYFADNVSNSKSIWNYGQGHIGLLDSLLHFAWVVDDAKCIVVTCVCVSVCMSVRGRMPTLLHGPGCNLRSGRGCPLVVHCWADLQSVHGLRCYGNITRTRNVIEYMLVLTVCLVIFSFYQNLTKIIWLEL